MKKCKYVPFEYFSCVSFSSVYRCVNFISIKDDLLKYQIMECCGQTYSSNFALRRHAADTHKTSRGIYRCFAEKCRKNFRRKASFVQHQLTHHYISDEFHLMTQAFQGGYSNTAKKLTRSRDIWLRFSARISHDIRNFKNTE